MFTNKLRIKNVGPIKDGYTTDDGFFPISKLTVFVGSQAAGKSTVAKILSTFLWLEKKLVCGDFSKSELEDDKDFVKNRFLYHGIASYITEKSEIDFIGERYNFMLRNKQVKINKNNGCYARPQIIYMPAERNLCSIVPSPSKIPEIPKNLSTLIEEYENANKYFADIDYNIPFSDFKTKFNSKTKERFVFTKGSKSKTELRNSASGLQSVIPLLLVSDYLNKSIDERIKNDGEKQNNSVETLQKIKNNFEEQIKKLKNDSEKSFIFASLFESNEWAYNFYSLNGFIKNQDKIKLERELTNVEQKIKNALENGIQSIINCFFINIIEEPEQNLFPLAQKSVIGELLKIANTRTLNKLFLTTHSPYVLEAINNSIYAAALKKKGKESERIIPLEYQISYSEVSAYAIRNGKIISIKNDDLKQIDPSEIDSCSKNICNEYDALSLMEFSENE